MLSARCKGSEHRLVDCNNYDLNTAQYYNRDAVGIQCRPGKDIMNFIIL